MVAIAKVREWRRLRHDAQPAKRIAFLVSPQHKAWDRLPAYAVIAVAAGDIIAVDPLDFSVLFVGHVGSSRRQLVQLDVVRFVDDLSAGCIPGRIEVLGDRGLA